MEAVAGMAYPQETGNLSLEGVRTGLLGTGEGLVQERVGESSLEPRVSWLSVRPHRGKTTCFVDLSAGVQGVPSERFFK